MYIAELNSSGQVVTGYIYGPAGPICDIVNGQPRFYLFDGLGNTRQLVSATGQVIGQADYTAWGGLLETAGQTTPIGFKGQRGAYRDAETGFILLGARYYLPGIDRFISRDRSGYSAGTNLYGFCNGDPVNFFDPTGCGDTLEDGPGWSWVRGGAALIGEANAPQRLLGLPCINPLGTLMAAHDAFRDWGEACMPAGGPAIANAIDVPLESRCRGRRAGFFTIRASRRPRSWSEMKRNYPRARWLPLLALLCLAAGQPQTQQPAGWLDRPPVVTDGTTVGRRVLALYYPWYATPAVSHAWAHYDGVETANHRMVSHTHYPASGPYESTDAG